MIGPDDVYRWADLIYDDFLRSLVNGTDFFSPPPRRDRLGRVPAGDDPNTFLAAVQPLWDGSRAKRGFGYTVILESRQRRSRGTQNEPVAVELPTRADYLTLLDRAEEVAAFEVDMAFILARFPVLRPVLQTRPRIVVENHGAWEGILEVVGYLCAYPRPGCFVRALPVSVHTKFIEQHQSAIEALLVGLPAAGYDTAGDSFETRCGFLSDDGAVRGRFLCPRLQATCGFPVFDVELRLSAWAAIVLPPETVVIACENKANFLALPPMSGVLALWGGGGAVSGHFPRIAWLANHPLFYWGDLDPCGFAILARLRRAFPSVRSVLMDSATLEQNRSQLLPAKLPPGGIVWDYLLSHEEAVARELHERALGLEQEKLIFNSGLDVLFASGLRPETAPHSVKLP